MTDLFTSADAIFPADGYRTYLFRAWGEGPRLCVIGQNPSLADAVRSDATVTRCARRARMLGLDGLDMVNLFPFVTPYPDELFAAADPLGLTLGIDADAAIIDVAGRAGLVIAAWGGDRRQAARVAHVRRLLQAHGIEVHALGFTRDGSPRHPSRLAYAVPAVLWPFAEAP